MSNLDQKCPVTYKGEKVHQYGGSRGMEKRYIGVDLGGTNIKVGVVDPAGKLLYKTERPTRAEEGTIDCFPFEQMFSVDRASEHL